MYRFRLQFIHSFCTSGISEEPGIVKKGSSNISLQKGRVVDAKANLSDEALGPLYSLISSADSLQIIGPRLF